MVRDRQFHDDEFIMTPAGGVAVEIQTAQTVVYAISSEMGKQLLDFGYRYDAPAPPEPAPPPEPTPEPTPEPKPKPKPVETVFGVEFAILNRSVDSLEAGLSTGDFDGQLDDLLECEKNSKNRKTAIEAIERRMDLGEE
jgi:hypothetical protein